MSLKGIAKETLRILDEGRYVAENGETIPIGAAVRAAVDGTELYTPHRLATLMKKLPEPLGASGPPTITVTDETTQVAAERLARTERTESLALLNFASARNPGGGFIRGAKAQEEDVARCSALYPCLVSQSTYYEVNRAQSSMLYTDHIIWSPAVPFFKVRSRGPLLDAPFLAGIITAPAPNAGQALRRDAKAGPQIEETLRRRAGYVLAIAAEQGMRDLVLGAWGCGVFKNDPQSMAEIFDDWLRDPRFSGAFDRIVFAIPSKVRANYDAFAHRFD